MFIELKLDYEDEEWLVRVNFYMEEVGDLDVVKIV